MSFYKKCQTRCASWRNDNNLDNQFSMNILTTDLELEILRESSKSYWPFLPSNLATNQEIGKAQSVFSIYLQESRPKTKQVKFIPGQINFHKSQRIGWRSCHGIKRQHSSPVLKIFLITWLDKIGDEVSNLEKDIKFLSNELSFSFVPEA